MPVDAETFRELMAAFPSGVAIVTTVDGAGAPRGLTTQSFIAVSLDPPLVLVSIDKTSRTLPALRSTKAFVVNVLAEGQEELARLFASKAEEKFTETPWAPSALAKGAPILSGCSIAYAECGLVREIEAGDHWLLVASVEGARAMGGRPLAYHRRAYAGLSSG